MAKPGLDFEKAVFAFVKALSVTAKPYFDHRVPDRDTGRNRQVDCWIEANLLDHFPIAVLVSCKDHKRPVNVSTMGSFCDEIRSTSANLGVMYSTSGYTKQALAKAKTNGISCCRLFRNEATDLPQILIIQHYYFCRPRAGAALIEARGLGDEFRILRDVFDLRVAGKDNKTILETIYETYRRGESESRQQTKEHGRKPSDWSADLTLADDASGISIKFRVECHWLLYRSKMEAILVNGSYNLANKSFLGSQSGPSIDTQSVEPGEGWEEMKSDLSLPPGGRYVLCVVSGGKFVQSQIDALGMRPIPREQD